MTINSRVLLGLTALFAVCLLAGCSSNSGATKPADIKAAIKGTPLPADQMARIEAASAAAGQAQQDKAKASQKPSGPPPPPGSH